MTEPGSLIAVEGGEGAGKSTQAARLGAALDALVTREPGGTALGERVRSLLLDPSHGHIDPRAELMLMLAARAQHVADVIEPALATGRWVVVDRFSYSTLAYQGYGRGLPLDEVRDACDLATAGRWPDLTVVLDVDIAKAALRKLGEAADRIERADAAFHLRVRSGFLTLAAQDCERAAVVDASQSFEAVESEIRTVVRERLGR